MQAVGERDKQISSFKEELERATKEMQETSEMVLSLQAQLRAGNSPSSAHKKRLSDLVGDAQGPFLSFNYWAFFLCSEQMVGVNITKKEIQ